MHDMTECGKDEKSGRKRKTPDQEEGGKPSSVVQTVTTTVSEGQSPEDEAQHSPFIDILRRSERRKSN